MTHLILVLSILGLLQPDTDFGGLVGLHVAPMILDAAEILIPAAVAISAIHKLMEHRDTAGSLVIELLTKGGGTILAIELLKLMLPQPA